MRKPVRLPVLPPETSLDDRIVALRSEELLLEQYASTKGLKRLRERLGVIRQTLHRLRGLPLEPDLDGE